MKMKSFSGLFFVVCLFCAVIAFPTSNLDDDAEIVVVPLKEQQDQTNFGYPTNKNVNNFDGVIVTDVHPGFFSSSPMNPYNWNLGFLDQFHDMIRQLRERVYNVWSEAPVDSEKSENTPTVKSNSTSRVENFELDDDNNQQQQLQNQHQHHQRQQQQQHQQEQSLLEENYTNNRLEEFMPNSPPLPPREHSWESTEDENENETIDMNEHYPVDLSNDIAINQMAADQGVPYDSDAEIFNINEYIQHPISTTYEFVPIVIKK